MTFYLDSTLLNAYLATPKRSRLYSYALGKKLEWMFLVLFDVVRLRVRENCGDQDFLRMYITSRLD